MAVTSAAMWDIIITSQLRAPQNNFALSYTSPIRLAGDMRPTFPELARTMVAFTVGIPLAYFAVRLVLAVVGL